MSQETGTKAYQIEYVRSDDGTRIGYRRMGQGPGVILIHGGMEAAQSFMRLAAALAKEFTVYVPDRRGRGASGPYGNGYGISKDVQDMTALLTATEAQNVFGLSSGAIIALFTALGYPAIKKLALYEPPLSTNGSTDLSWLPRFDKEVAEGKIADAMLTGIRGSGDTSILSILPRFLVMPILNKAMGGDEDKPKGDDVSLSEIVPTLHYDAEIVAETDGPLERFKPISAKVLLLGGSKSAAYLKKVLDGLEPVFEHMQRIEFPGLDHIAASNEGKPEIVADALARFFRE